MKKMNTFSIITSLSLVLVVMYAFKKSENNYYLDPSKLVEPLKSYYHKLQDKGYNPQTNPKSHSLPFVSFTIKNDEGKDLTITANSVNLILFNELGKSYLPIKKTDDGFIRLNKFVSDKKDLFEGVLEIVENKSYE